MLLTCQEGMTLLLVCNNKQAIFELLVEYYSSSITGDLQQ